MNTNTIQYVARILPSWEKDRSLSGHVYYTHGIYEQGKRTLQGFIARRGRTCSVYGLNDKFLGVSNTLEGAANYFKTLQE